MNAIRQGVTGTLGHVAMIALLVLPCVLGNYAAYVALLAILVALLVGFDWQAMVVASRLVWVRMLAAAFVLLAIAFTVSAKTQREALYSLDFLPLLLVVPAIPMLSRVKVGNGALYLARLSLAGTLAAVLSGSYDLFVLGLDRAKGIENNAIHFADYAMILGVIALLGVVADRSRWRWIYLLGPVLALVATMMSGTRGALLVGAALLVIFVLGFWRHWIGQWRLALLALVAGLAVVAGVALVAEAMGYGRPFSVFSVPGEILAGQGLDRSTAVRLDFYASGFRAFLDAPWFGHGWQNQITSALTYMRPETLAAYEVERWGFIHNDPLGFAISGGLLGFAAYWLIVLSPIVAYFAVPKPQRSELQLSLTLTLALGYMLSGVTEAISMWELPKMFFVIGATAIAVLAGRRQQEG